jgi:UDP-GlcNAc:undecaprenyl-phosphate/decaprenyl-phosphate GlcNAc-1-phosphate transferase
VGSALGFVLTRLFVRADASGTLFMTYTLLLLLSVCVGRSSYSILAHLRDSQSNQGRRIAVYGAGSRGLMAVQEMQRIEALAMTPVGFIDDDPIKLKRRLGGLQVLGGVTDLERIIRDNRVEGILLASDDVPLERLQIAMRACAATHVQLFRFNVGVQSLAQETVSSTVVIPVIGVQI